VAHPYAPNEVCPSMFLVLPMTREGNIRDPSWTQDMNQSSITHTDPVNTGSTIPIDPPTLVDVEGSASDLTSPEIPYVEDEKMGLPNLDTSTPYTFAPNRPLSPTASTTSSSSSTMTSPFQFPFPENPAPNERLVSGFRRRSTDGAESTPHDGTAHIPVVSDDERYRVAAPRRDRENGEAESYRHTPHNPSRRATDSRSRSPSPTGPPISSTLAVTKAQVFGALRRTRTRQKKGSEGAAKAALRPDALESGTTKSNE